MMGVGHPRGSGGMNTRVRFGILGGCVALNGLLLAFSLLLFASAFSGAAADVHDALIFGALVIFSAGATGWSCFLYRMAWRAEAARRAMAPGDAPAVPPP